MRGHQEPPESQARGTFSKGLPRNLGNTSASLATTKWWSMSSDSQGRPETRRKGCGGDVRTRSTDDNGEPDDEMHRDPDEGRGEQDDASVRGNIAVHRYRINYVNGT
jgi:hypothetical protein